MAANLPSRKGPVRSHDDHTRDNFDARPLGKNTGDTVTKGGVRRSPNTKQSGVGGPAGRDNAKTPTERGVRRVPNTKRV